MYFSEWYRIYAATNTMHTEEGFIIIIIILLLIVIIIIIIVIFIIIGLMYSFYEKYNTTKI